MNENANPLAGPRLWDEVAESYSGEIAPHFARYAEDALRIAHVGPGMRIADVACGPGTLSLVAARLGATPSAVDFSPKMVARLGENARRQGVTCVDARVGDGMALPFADASFDAAFSMFGLMFFPDRSRGFRELLRVLRPGGAAVVASWVPTERVPVFADIYGTLGALLPSLPFAAKPPLAEASELAAEMTAAGFAGVEVHASTHVLETPSIEAFWEALERSTPPIHLAREALGAVWHEVRRKLVSSLLARWGTGPQRIAMSANLGAGRRPA